MIPEYKPQGQARANLQDRSTGQIPAMNQTLHTGLA